LVTIFNKTQREVILLLHKSQFGVNQNRLNYTDANELYENIYVPDTMHLSPQREVTLETYPITFDWQQQFKGQKLQRFDRSDSPFVIKNNIAYRQFGDSETKVVQNEFWVTSVQKMTKPDFKNYNEMSNRKSANFFVKKTSTDLWVEVAFVAIDVLTFALINGG